MGFLSFFGIRSQNNALETVKLTPVLQHEYRKKLRVNSNKDFNSEFIRRTNLEFEIVKKHGFVRNTTSIRIEQ